MTTQRHHPAHRRHTSRRGATFLEAVLGVVLLGLVTASLAGAVSFIAAGQGRMEQRLGASELASRLILQYIDDSESLPSPSLPIEYDENLFRWELERQRVQFVVRQEGVAVETNQVGGGVSLDRIKLVIVRVWLAPESGGTRSYTPDVPNAVLTRLIDPLAMTNPDSLQTLLEQPDGIERLLNQLMDIDAGTSGVNPEQNEGSP